MKNNASLFARKISYKEETKRSSTILGAHSKLQQRKFESILRRYIYIYIYIFDRSLFIFVSRSRILPNRTVNPLLGLPSISVRRLDRAPGIISKYSSPTKYHVYARVGRHTRTWIKWCVNLLQTERAIARNTTVIELL